jgi:hypothetical protein
LKFTAKKALQEAEEAQEAAEAATAARAVQAADGQAADGQPADGRAAQGAVEVRRGKERRFREGLMEDGFSVEDVKRYRHMPHRYCRNCSCLSISLALIKFVYRLRACVSLYGVHAATAIACFAQLPVLFAQEMAARRGGVATWAWRLIMKQ